MSKSTGERYFVNTNTGESVNELPEGIPFGTDNIEGYESFVCGALMLALFEALASCTDNQLMLYLSVLPGTVLTKTTSRTNWTKRKRKRDCVVS